MKSVQDASVVRTGTPARAGVSPDPSLIFDVGLNVGQDTAFYLSQGYRVLAIDADPTLAESARKKFAREILTGQLTVLNVGIAATEGLADFWICEDKPEFNSFHRAIAARNSYSQKCIQVPVMPFEAIIERFGVPYYLKIDIEGNDKLCLDALSPSSLPPYLSVESECPLDEKSASVEDGVRTLQQLYGLGYRKFKLVNQYTFCALSWPPSLHYGVDALARRALNLLPAKSRLSLDFMSRHLLARRRLEKRFQCDFPLGGSGPWGEDTPGRWISYSEAERAYRRFRTRHFLLTQDAEFHSFWCDWHAKL
jgi:FkbM family methyltransferase